MLMFVLGCPSKPNDPSNNSKPSTIQNQLKEIDDVAWYIKFDKGSDDSQWEATIRIDEGGLSSKTYMFTDDTFEGVVNKTWIKCQN